MAKLITTPQEARLAIFEHTRHLINRISTSNIQEKKASMIWSVNDMIPYVNNDSHINVSSMQFTCTLGGHVFNYSIGMNVGEVRLGILIPESLKENTLEIIDSLDLYDYQSEFSPNKIVRILKAGVFFDHVFNHRFGSVEVTYKALSSQHDVNAVAVIADAIALELIHINHGLMHGFAEKGYLVTSSGIYNNEEQKALKIESKLQAQEIINLLNIDAVQLLSVSPHTYIVIAPISNTDIENQVEALNIRFSTLN